MTERATRREQAILLLAVIAMTVVPLIFDVPHGPPAWFAAGCLVLSGLSLLWWRSRPAVTLAAGLGLVLVAASPSLNYEPSDASLPLLSAFAGVAAERFGGRAAVMAALGLFGFLGILYPLTGESGPALLIFLLPGYFAGTVLRLRRRTVEELQQRALEIEQERELFTTLSVRHERARIAAELHDIIGHALSVMVVQAAAGQRLVERDPERAGEAMAAIASSAQQGRADLRRLVELLGGEEVVAPDLSLIDEVVRRAADGGLQVTARFEGERDGVSAECSHMAFRVVQEGLTNALRHAPGAAVEVLVRGGPDERSLTVQVLSQAPVGVPADPSPGSGQGLRGLRERIQDLGGWLRAGATPSGGWLVEAHLPQA